MTAIANEPSPKASGRLWAWLPAMLLGSLLGTQLTVLHFVLDDPGFALEPNYYRKSVAWDAQRDLARRSVALGWHAELDAELEPEASVLRVRARLTEQGGAALSGASVQIRAFANARASRILESELTESSAGIYEAELAAERPGLWEIRLLAQRGPDTFEQLLRLDLPSGGAVP